MIGAPTTEFRRLRRATTRKPAGFFAALVVFIIVILVAAPQAQQSTLAGNTAATPVASPRVSADGTTEIDLLVGRSTILNVGSPITRVSLTVPDIADALVTAPTQLLIHGKQPGTISLFVWDRGGSIKTFEVNVRRDLKVLSEQMKQLFPNEPITVAGSGKDVVLSGTVSSTYVREKAADVAAGFVEKKENVVNLLQQQEGVASNQVLLRVRFAEVSRSALQELGATWIANGFKDDWFARVSTQQFAAPVFDSDRPGGLVFSDFLNLFVFNAKEGLGSVVRALQNKGLFQSLAEPNLIASNGKEATFLAGGEYPYPIAQPGSGGVTYTIMFKEFGVRLAFTPTVLGGDLIHLKVKPEVSALDFANAITLQGFRIPALSTRRTETEVELRDGQTFAIAGLMNNTLTNSMSRIPGIGDIPVLGLLFRSKAHQKNQTELVVMITPHIVRRGSMGASEGLPTLVEPYLGAPNKAYPTPAPYIGSPRYPSNRPAPANETMAPAPTPEHAPVQNAPVQQRPAELAPVQLTPQPAPLQGRPVGQQPAAAAAPAGPVPSRVEGPTKEQLKAIQRAREEERKAAAEAERLRLEHEKREAEERRAAEAAAAKQQAEQAKKDEEERRRTEKLEKERAKREAEVAKKNAEIARKKAEEDAKREKALADAAERLKAAQAAYQSELDKAKGGSNDKKNPGGNPRY
ncbi:MAG TPA: pilus assembly protein N-terminal domain-containing protein [Vicinamibacterales bacterium]|nr:pilus assembly protein N-terminal domain-containing protein [Vicinamibacterales bacterium]